MSQQILSLSLSALKPHPRNEEFFSNAEGEDYNRLKESIAELGILTPLRVSSDMVIISGHQRYRAAKELEIKNVPVIIDESLSDEDAKLQQLIAANFGRMKNDPVKQGRWIKEYERLRGVKRGNNQHMSFGNNFRPSQEDIAAELGVDTRTLRNLKSLNTLLPELQDIISEGRINATTGFKILARLSEDEQQQLLEALPATEKFTQKQIEAYVAQIRQGYEAQIATLTAEKEAAQQEVEGLQEAAVDAQNAIRAQSDSETYMKMKEDLDNQKQKTRTEYESRMTAERDLRRVEKEKEDAERQLQVALREAKAYRERAEMQPKEVVREVIVEKEVYPADYITMKDRIAELEAFEKSIVKNEVQFITTDVADANHYKNTFFQNIGTFLTVLEEANAGRKHITAFDSYEQEHAMEMLTRMRSYVGTLESELKMVTSKGVA